MKGVEKFIKVSTDLWYGDTKGGGHTYKYTVQYTYHREPRCVPCQEIYLTLTLYGRPKHVISTDLIPIPIWVVWKKKSSQDEYNVQDTVIGMGIWMSNGFLHFGRNKVTSSISNGTDNSCGLFRYKRRHEGTGKRGCPPYNQARVCWYFFTGPDPLNTFFSKLTEWQSVTTRPEPFEC